MVDLVRPLKLENPADGGTGFDSFPTELNPLQDYTAVKGVAIEDDNILIDKDGSNNLTFTDTVTGAKTLAQLSASGGDLVGPASSTDNAISRFDGTTGKLVQNSNVLINDSGAIDVAGNFTFPFIDGSSNQFLKTDGAGTVTWEEQDELISVTATYNAADKNIILCDATTSAFTVNLPLASSSVNKVYTIKKIDNSTNEITVDANGSELIDGELTQDLDEEDSMTIICDGTGWLII